MARAADVIAGTRVQVQLIDDLLDLASHHQRQAAPERSSIDLRTVLSGGRSTPPVPPPPPRGSRSRALEPGPGSIRRPARLSRWSGTCSRTRSSSRRGAAGSTPPAARGLPARDRGERHGQGIAPASCPTSSSGSGRPTARARAATGASASAGAREAPGRAARRHRRAESAGGGPGAKLR